MKQHFLLLLLSDFNIKRVLQQVHFTYIAKKLVPNLTYTFKHSYTINEIIYPNLSGFKLFVFKYEFIHWNKCPRRMFTTRVFRIHILLTQWNGSGPMWKWCWASRFNFNWLVKIWAQHKGWTYVLTVVKQTFLRTHAQLLDRAHYWSRRWCWAPSLTWPHPSAETWFREDSYSSAICTLSPYL